MVKFLVTYVTKCMADVLLKTISIKHKIVNLKTIFQLWCTLPEFCIIINSLLISLILCPRVVFTVLVDIS